ncbi:TfuA-like protein [Pelagibius sp. 7325]|uniref:TfuA-like protein n=1 Tax=Pelagibius sp. 7325 TaxID=3131994 RepID=UPI0030EBB7BA
MTVAVFLGPSLPLAEAESLLAADYHPPVRQGDIYRLVMQRRPSAIAVVDGYFQEVPSVWHKEILWALDQGIPVYGSASMGALRAAELAAYGMVGHGKIYEAYRSGHYAPYDGEIFEDDDEVAVIHGPAELAFPALSDAMVDIRETCAAAAQAGVIDAALRDALVAAFKRRYYHHRSFEALSEVLDAIGAEPRQAALLKSWLPEGRVFQKKDDARSLLARLASGEVRQEGERQSFVFERTTLWAQFVEEAADGAAAVSNAERDVLEELRLDPDLYLSLREAALLCLQLAAPAPVLVDEEGRRAALDRLRHRHGLMSRAALDDWAESCDLDRAGLDRLLAFEAAAETAAAEAGPALDVALLDVLRREGRYAALAARARDKAQRLSGHKTEAAAHSALSSGALLDWYFENCLGRGVPRDVAGYAAGLGYDGVQGLLSALSRERAYRVVSAATPGDEPAGAVPSDCGGVG